MAKKKITRQYTVPKRPMVRSGPGLAPLVPRERYTAIAPRKVR